MEKGGLSGRLAVILHADVAGSTGLVQQDEQIAHRQIQDTFRRFGDIIKQYHGRVRELRGDAILAEFERASGAVSAALAFQAKQNKYPTKVDDDIRPQVRVGIAMGEVVVADNTITGEGVVLAQRLEQLANPGGVVIQAATFETVPRRFPFEFTDLGGHEVKGFDKPVQAYSVNLQEDADLPPPERIDRRTRYTRVAIAAVSVAAFGIALVWFKPWEVREEPASLERMAFPLPDKPSIAVLPFTNMSDLAEQEYFVDGMTEDLITDISKIPEVFVIARNSVFTSKGKAVKVRQVAEELGVRYVMEGSVQRTGNQVRINAQLIDATTGGHVWAERYDGILDDVFAMRDEITRNIVAALEITFVDQSQAGQDRVETDSSEAYDMYLLGWARYRLFTPEDIVKAIAHLENAVELDPNFARAHAALAASYFAIWNNGWSSVGIDYDKAWKMTNQHLELAMKDPTPLAHRIRAKQHEYAGQTGKALADAERAIELDPNDPDGYVAMGSLMVNLDWADEGLEFIQKAMRLDPQSDYMFHFGWAQFHLERYAEAADSFSRAIRRNPDDQWLHLNLAASYGHLGREQEAIAAFATFNEMNQRLNPTVKDREWTLAKLSGWGIQNEAVLDRIRFGLRVAGVSEGDTVPAHLKFTELVIVTDGTFDIRGAIEVDVAEAKELHDSGASFFDSRGKSVFGSGHIPGAIHLLFHQVWEGLADIVDEDAPIVFYCSDPQCHLAAHSSAQALTLGYTRVYYFAGGFAAWGDAGYPVEGSL